MAVPSRGDDDEVVQLQLEGQRREEERSGVDEKGGWQVLGKIRSTTTENRGAVLIHIRVG